MSDARASEPSRNQPGSGIAQPELRKHGLGYVALFNSHGVRVVVESLQRVRGGLVGDVTVAIGPVNESWQILTSGRLDLASISQRESWERRLGRRDGDTKRWGAILDGVCAAVLRAERRVDAPAMLLRDAEDPPVGNMALAPLVLSNLPTIWFGADGSLKSYVALAAVLSLHTGVQLLGIEPTRQYRCAYANFEPFAAGEHKLRMQGLLGTKIGQPDLTYIDCYGSTLNEQVERIQRIIRDEGIEFLCLDSISFAADGPLNDDETARRFWQAVGQVGVPMLATGHTPKTGEEVFGSRFWRAGARLAWFVTKFDSDGDKVNLRFTCQKASVQAVPKPVGVTFDFARGGVDILTTLDPISGEHLHDRIVTLLHRRPAGTATYAELALMLGAQENSVRRAVAEHPKHFTVLDPLDGGRSKRIAIRADSEE